MPSWIKKTYEGAGRLSREVVSKRVLVVAAVGTVAGYAVAQGWVTPELSDEVQHDVEQGFTLLSLLIGVFWARQGATPADPTKDPVSKNGLPLVELTPEPNIPADFPSFHGGTATGAPLTGGASSVVISDSSVDPRGLAQRIVNRLPNVAI